MSAGAYRSLLAALDTCSRVLLTGPVEPDGDSIGACLALQRVLARSNPRLVVDVAGVPAYRYDWMPGADDMLPEHRVGPHYDGVVVLDGDRNRLLPGVAEAFAAARVKGIVDHHASTTPDGYTDTWIEPDAPSTCEMLYRAFQHEGEPVDRRLATLLYVGAVFDTGGFRYSNTTPDTHRMAAHLLECGIDHATICSRVLADRRWPALRHAGDVFRSARLHVDGLLAVGRVSLADQERYGLVPGDLEGVVDALVHVCGVQVAGLLIERRPGSVKASLRSRGVVNVARVAGDLSATGGGHAKAAGANLSGSLDLAEQRLVQVIERALLAGGEFVE